MSDPTIQYTPREMLAAMRQFPRPTNFLSTMFVGIRNKTNKTHIEIDKVIGSQVVAGYVNRAGGPNVVGKKGLQTLMHVAPYMYEQLPYTPSDVDVRASGNTVYDDPAASLAGRVNMWLGELEDRFIRAEERQVAEALQTGKVAVSGKDVDYEIDFDQKATHIKDVSATTPWSTTGNALDNLTDWVQQIEDTGAPSPDVLVGDTLSMRALINDAEVLALLDNRRVERGIINIRLIRGQRATYLGNLKGVGFDLDLYSYQGVYDDVSTGSAVSTRYMNAKTVVLGSTQADVRFHYAKIENFKTGDFIGERFPNNWETDDGKNRFLTMESSPCVGLHQTDAFIVAIVLP